MVGLSASKRGRRASLRGRIKHREWGEETGSGSQQRSEKRGRPKSELTIRRWGAPAHDSMPPVTLPRPGSKEVRPTPFLAMPPERAGSVCLQEDRRVVPGPWHMTG